MRLAPLCTVAAVLTVVTQWGDSSCSPFVGCWGGGGGGEVQVTHLEIDGRGSVANKIASSNTDFALLSMQWLEMVHSKCETLSD